MWLRRRTVRLWCRLPEVIWALDAISADAQHCCPALLPTRVIAGQGIGAHAGTTERAPRIRIRRLRIAKLRFAEQRSGNNKKPDHRHARHRLSPYRRCWLPSLSLLLRRTNQCPAEPASVLRPFRAGPAAARPLGWPGSLGAVTADVAMPPRSQKLRKKRRPGCCWKKLTWPSAVVADCPRWHAESTTKCARTSWP